MKFIIILLFSVCFSLYSHSDISTKHRDSALETNGIKVEYYTSSQTGIIAPIDCHTCIQSTYKFYSDLEIQKEGKSITLSEFMQDYWNAKYPTLFINLETTEVERVSY